MPGLTADGPLQIKRGLLHLAGAGYCKTAQALDGEAEFALDLPILGPLGPEQMHHLSRDGAEVDGKQSLGLGSQVAGAAQTGQGVLAPGDIQGVDG